MSRIVVPDRLTAGDVVLRPPVRTDVPAIVEACQDPEIPRFTTVPSPYGEAEGRGFVELSEQDWSEGTGAPYLIVDAGSAELLGSMGLMRLADGTGTCSVGYWVAAGARGRGIATRALRLVVAAALRGGARRIELKAMTDNVGSRRVAERVGFTLEGVLRSVLEHGCSSERIDLALYSMLPTDAAALELLDGSAVA